MVIPLSSLRFGVDLFIKVFWLFWSWWSWSWLLWFWMILTCCFVWHWGESIQIFWVEIHVLQIINLRANFISLLDQFSVGILLASLNKLWMGLVELFLIWIFDYGVEHIISIVNTQVFATSRHIGLNCFYFTDFNIFSWSPSISICSRFWRFNNRRLCLIHYSMGVFLSINLSLLCGCWASFNQFSVLSWRFIYLFFLLCKHLLQIWGQIHLF